MRSSVQIRSFLVACIFFAALSAVSAQTEKQLTPSDLKQQTVVTEPVTLLKGFLRFGAMAGYRVADRYFNDSGGKEYYPYNIWSTKSAYNITLQYGLSDRFETGLFTEFMINKVEGQTTQTNTGTNTTTTTETDQKGIGIGDTRIELRYQLVPEKRYKVSLVSKLNVTIPTGQKNPTNIISSEKYDLPVGNGIYALSGELFARSVVYPYSFTAYLKYTHNFTGSKKIRPADTAERHFKLGNRIETGAGINLLLNDWIVFSNDFRFIRDSQGTIESNPSPLFPVNWSADYVPNMVFQVKKFRLSESVSIPLLGKNVPADPLFLMSVQYIF